MTGGVLSFARFDIEMTERSGKSNRVRTTPSKG